MKGKVAVFSAPCTELEMREYPLPEVGPEDILSRFNFLPSRQSRGGIVRTQPYQASKARCRNLAKRINWKRGVSNHRPPRRGIWVNSQRNWIQTLSNTKEVSFR